MKNEEIIEFESTENIEKNKMEEGNWVFVLDFPEYMCSDMGHIRETKSGKILKEHEDENGYLRVLMSDGENKRLVLIHHVIYFSFHPEDMYRIIEEQLEQEMLDDVDKDILEKMDDSVVN